MQNEIGHKQRRIQPKRKNRMNENIGKTRSDMFIVKTDSDDMIRKKIAYVVNSLPEYIMIKTSTSEKYS